MLLLLTALACTSPAPTPLPPSKAPSLAAEGRMVRAGTVQGFLAQPRTKTTRPLPGILILIPEHSEATRADATSRATTGARVLAIDPTVSTPAATDYLRGMSTTAEIETVCLRAACP